MKQGTLKTTVVLVSTSDETKVFRSVEAVPAQVRRRILATAKTGHSATILIADRRGKKELMRAVQGLPSPVTLRASRRTRKQRSRSSLLPADWIELVLVGTAASLLWAAALLG